LDLPTAPPRCPDVISGFQLPFTSEQLGEELQTGFAGQRIASTARRAAQRWNLSQHDEEELAQDLRLHLARVANRFAPDRGNWAQFASTVIARRAISLSSVFRRRLRRGHPAGGHVSPRLDELHIGQCLRRRGRRPRTEGEARDLRVELARALNALPPPLRSLCGHLAKRSVSELARQLGIPRRTLRDRIKTVREFFRDRQLDQYL